MKAILKYGPFTTELEVEEAKPMIVIVRPHSIDFTVLESEDYSVVQTTHDKLVFHLDKSPTVGELLEYSYR